MTCRRIQNGTCVHLELESDRVPSGDLDRTVEAHLRFLTARTVRVGVQLLHRMGLAEHWYDIGVPEAK
ncbi:hypothetical protein ACIQ9Q_40730 [Streptomyces sp. NPDC094438]|uniref:hypothetical protein n=1 Tax=Streptomyces sp. NPDC094438 TaxID=3366061 RepID=UPI00380C1996